MTDKQTARVCAILARIADALEADNAMHAEDLTLRREAHANHEARADEHMAAIRAEGKRQAQAFELAQRSLAFQERVTDEVAPMPSSNGPGAEVLTLVPPEAS